MSSRTRTATAERERFSDPLQSFGHVARLTFRAFARSLEQRIMPHGITIGQWRFLRELWREDGITQRELSRRLTMREPSTVAAVRSLELAGLVRRVRNPGDRRKMHIHLTDKAKALRDPLLAEVAEVNAIATRGIPEADLEAARRVFLKLRENLDEAGSDQPLCGEDEA